MKSISNGFFVQKTKQSISSFFSDIRLACFGLKGFKEITTFDDNGHFKEEVTYNFDLSFITDNFMITINFKKDGSAVLKSMTKDESRTFDATYKYVNGFIEFKYQDTDSNDQIEYIDYHDDVMCFALTTFNNGERFVVTYALGAKQGSAVSQKEKKVLGYHFELTVLKGDEINVFDGTKNSKGYYITYYENGTFEKDSDEHFVLRYLNHDQIKGFDSSTAGIKWVEVTAENNTYKVPLYVCEKTA